MRQFVVDAFTDHVFAGNPAAVCILSHWIPDALMQDIAMENRFSETAFVVKEGAAYHLRWFTPGGEIDLCGHATLATAYVLLNHDEKEQSSVTFTTLSGELFVRRTGDKYEMEFPAYELRQLPVTDEMAAAFGERPQEAWLGRDLLCVFAEEETIRKMQPDMEQLARLPGLLQHATARGKAYDCVSRSFAPKLNVEEDPVCGSGHCHIAPYWSQRIGSTLTAYQASARGGVLYCRVDGEKVFLGGKAVLFSVADLMIDA